MISFLDDDTIILLTLMVCSGLVFDAVIPYITYTFRIFRIEGVRVVLSMICSILYSKDNILCGIHIVPWSFSGEIGLVLFIIWYFVKFSR